MAENPYINKVQTADGTVLMDLTQDTVASELMLVGTTAHSSSGATTFGSIPTYDGDFTVTSNT